MPGDRQQRLQPELLSEAATGRKKPKRRKAANKGPARLIMRMEPVDVGATAVRIANGTAVRWERAIFLMLYAVSAVAGRSGAS